MATTVIAKQQVTDFNTWKPAFDAGSGMRDELGILIKGVYQSAEDPNMVTIISEFPNAETAKALFSNESLQHAMEKGGVIATLDVNMLNEVK
jgi:hypothetical protein